MTTKKTAGTKFKVAARKPSSRKSSVREQTGTKSAKKVSQPQMQKKNNKKTKKENKKKVVRDSFTMPQIEYLKIAEIKAVCLNAGMHVKKSEVLRAGLIALAKLNPANLKRALSNLEKIKTGRPKKH